MTECTDMMITCTVHCFFSTRTNRVTQTQNPPTKKCIVCKILISVVPYQVHQTHVIFDTLCVFIIIIWDASSHKWSTYVEMFRTFSSIMFCGGCFISTIFILSILCVQCITLDNDKIKPPATISNTIQQTTSFLIPSKQTKPNQWQKIKEENKTEMNKASQIKVNKIRCHIKMLWHFASDLCVCVEHIDYGNKNRWIKVPTAIRNTYSHSKGKKRNTERSGSNEEQQEMIIADGLVNGFNADEMKNQNVNNNKAPDENLWHVSCESMDIKRTTDKDREWEKKDRVYVCDPNLHNLKESKMKREQKKSTHHHQIGSSAWDFRLHSMIDSLIFDFVILDAELFCHIWCFLLLLLSPVSYVRLSVYVCLYVVAGATFATSKIQ